MKNKSEWGNCSRCGKEITDKNFGGEIEAEELLVCNDCERQHKKNIIAELNKFRQSKDFSDRLALKQKILWTSESLGHYFDNATGTIRESVIDQRDAAWYLLRFELNLTEEQIGKRMKDFTGRFVPKQTISDATKRFLPTGSS
jgi:hypothetical protein